MTPTTSATTTSSVTPVTGAYEYLSNPANALLNVENPTVDISSLENRCQFPLGGLLTELIQGIFMQCLFNEDIKGFTALSCTNAHSFLSMRKLMNETPLTLLCPNLRILDARAFTFHADLRGIDRYKALQSYYKLEPFVEDREGLTIIFNQAGLTYEDMEKNICGVCISRSWEKESLDKISKEAAGPQMISNASITETRNKDPEEQETRVRDEVGFDGKPTLIESLALCIATPEKLKISPEWKITLGRTSTEIEGYTFVTEVTSKGGLTAYGYGFPSDICGAGGRLKLQVVGSGTPG